MLAKQAIIGLFVGLFLLTLSGQVLAYGVGTEAGVEVVASPTALAAAASFDYSNRDLVAIGTEAGGEVRASQKALQAAAERTSNQDPLHAKLIGTEAGLGSPHAGGFCPS